jgi:hypothetical protein
MSLMGFIRFTLAMTRFDFKGTPRWAKRESSPAQRPSSLSLLRSLAKEHRDEVLDGVVLRVYEQHD